MFARLRKYFFSGLAVFLPVGLTVFLFVWAANFIDGIVGKFVEPYLVNRAYTYYPGLGILIGVLFIIAIGFFVANYFGRKVTEFFEGLLLKLPFFRQVYPAIKEITLFFFSRERLKFKKVVLVEYPRKGVYSFGFVTNDTNAGICQKIGKDLLNVFIPSAPGPLTGYVILVPKEEVVETELTIEEAVKFIVSGGVVNPG